MKTHNNQDRCFWVFPGQGNHEAYRLPPEVVQLNRPGLPLYQAVAYWGAAIGTFFTRHDLSEAFGVPLRRARKMAYSLRDKPCGAVTLLFRLCHPQQEGDE